MNERKELMLLELNMLVRLNRCGRGEVRPVGEDEPQLDVARPAADRIDRRVGGGRDRASRWSS